MLLDVDGGVGVLLHQLLADEDRVLVVVALPGHEPDEDVPAKSDLAAVGGSAVRNDVALLHDLALGDHGPLVEAGALVAPLELGHLVLVGHARGGGDDHLGGGHVAHHAVLLGEDHDAGVGSRLILHAGGHHGGLGL